MLSYSVADHRYDKKEQYLEFLKQSEHHRVALDRIRDAHTPQEFDRIVDSKYNQYLDSTETLMPLTSSLESVDKSLQSFQREYLSAAQENSQGLQELTHGVNQNFSQLLGDLNNLGSTLVNSLQKLENSISWRLDEVGEKINITNNILTELVKAVKTPEFLKEKIFHFEKGLDYYRQSNLVNAYLDNALDNFLFAEKLTSGKADDPYLYYYIGLVYFYSTQHLDLDKAQLYFEKSYYFAQLEHKKLGVKACYELSKVLYVKTQFEEAVKWSDKGIELKERDFQFDDIDFNRIKYRCAWKQETDSDMRILVALIKKESVFILKTVEDKELKKSTKVIATLNTLRIQEVSCLERLISDFKKGFLRVLKDPKFSRINNQLNQLEKLNTYLDALQGRKMFPAFLENFNINLKLYEKLAASLSETQLLKLYEKLTSFVSETEQGLDNYANAKQQFKEMDTLLRKNTVASANLGLQQLQNLEDKLQKLQKRVEENAKYMDDRLYKLKKDVEKYRELIWSEEHTLIDSVIEFANKSQEKLRKQEFLEEREAIYSFKELNESWERKKSRIARDIDGVDDMYQHIAMSHLGKYYRQQISKQEFKKISMELSRSIISTNLKEEMDANWWGTFNSSVLGGFLCLGLILALLYSTLNITFNGGLIFILGILASIVIFRLWNRRDEAEFKKKSERLIKTDYDNY